jgi:hypothetical protein
MKKQYAHIEIKPLDKRPDDWTNAKAWPGQGLYLPANDNGWMSLVTADGVTILYQGLPDGAVINDHPGTSDGINETLLLKAIAAASRAEVLKGA